MRALEVSLGEAIGLPELNNVRAVGYDGTDDHPHRVIRDPSYTHRRDVVRAIHYAWMREWKRPDHAPRLGVWLGGPKGAGKTSAVEQYFAALGVPVAKLVGAKRLELADAIQTRTVIGGDVVPQDGTITLAMRGGYPLLIDECDLIEPDVLAGINEIIERGVVTIPDSGERVVAERGFLVFATGNTLGAGDLLGGYAGTKLMNRAFMSRFIKIDVGYPEPDVERELLISKFPHINPEAAGMFVQTANMIRAAYLGTKEGVQLSDTISTRELVHWVEITEAHIGLAAKGIDPRWMALEWVFVNGLPDEERTAVRELFAAAFGVPP